MVTTERERLNIYIGNTTASSLSLLGSLFIIITYSLFTDLRGYAFKMVLILALFDILNCIGFMIPTYDSTNKSIPCHIQAILINISSIAAILWTSVIAYSLHSIFHNESSKIKERFPLQVGGVSFFALISGVVPEVTDAYGRTAGWCWITLNGMNYNFFFYQRLSFLFIPLCLAIVFNATVYARVFRRVIVLPDDDMSGTAKKGFVRKLKLYPLILILCYLPFTVKQALEMTSVRRVEYMYVLTLISGVMRCLHGICNAVVYGFTGKIRKRIRAALQNPRIKSTKGMSMPFNATMD